MMPANLILKGSAKSLSSRESDKENVANFNKR